MKQTAVEWYIEKIKEARQMCDDTSMEIDIWHTLDVLIGKGEQAKEMEKQQQSYSEEEVLNFTQTILMQYKFGNTNIEQLDLLKETLDLFQTKEMESKQNENVICKHCKKPISVSDINNHLFMAIKGGGLIHWNCETI